MKSVTIVKVLVVVFAFSRTFVSGAFLSPGVEHGGQGGQGTGTQRYDREFLISLQTPQVPFDFPFELFPAEMTNRVNVRKRRKRGKRGGMKRRMRRNKTKLPLPSMIVSNVRSINPKSPNHNFDELLANCRFTREFRDASLLCFSETWFMDKVTNESVEIVGFGEPYRSDRDSRQTGKERGGGVCLYVSEKFCDRANVTVKQRIAHLSSNSYPCHFDRDTFHVSSGVSSSLSSMPLFTIRPLLHVLGMRSPPPSVTFS